MDKFMTTHIPDFHEFLCVDELNQFLLDLVGESRVTDIGKSQEGHAILCGTIGKGRENALVFGFPHPNEAVGSLTCLSLLNILLSHKKLQERFTWHVIPCADPDGAKLNEGWFKGRFDLKQYIYHFYRSQPSIRVDDSFPVHYKDYVFENSPPNVLALKHLIETTKPRIVYPLHNGAFGGAFFYITQPMPHQYYERIITLCNQLSIPLDVGETDSPFMKALKKPFYQSFSFEEFYDYSERLNLNPNEVLNQGTNSIGFAKRWNPHLFGLIGEVPYICDPQISNHSFACRRKQENTAEALTIQLERHHLIEEIMMRSNTRHDNSIFYAPLILLIKHEKKYLEAQKQKLEEEKDDKPSTIAEQFRDLVLTRFYSSLDLGMLRRWLKASKQTTNNEHFTKKVEDNIEEMVVFIEKNSTYTIVPITHLIQLQLECLFASLNYL